VIVARAAPCPVRRGLTLLEALIASALVGALLWALFAFFFQLLAARARAVEVASKHLAATTLIDHVEADLMTCLVADGREGAGVAGDSRALRILCRSVAGSTAPRGAADPAVFADLQLDEFRFARETGRIEARRRVVGDARAPERFTPIGGAVGAVRFRYHDGTAWRDSFDSQESDRLPLAVEIAVWFDAEPAPDSGSGRFDERSFALESDADVPPARPQRLRVIAVPDAAGDAEAPRQPETGPAAGKAAAP
jgi:type II secretory pathway component PulJ